MNLHYDYIIVGGGISGSALARALALRETKVLLIERTGRRWRDGFSPSRNAAPDMIGLRPDTASDRLQL